MNPIDSLLNRKSHNKLIAPAPNKQQVELMMKAALRAPDHAQLRPWKYYVFKGDSLKQLGEYFVTASTAVEPSLSEEKINKIRNKPLRAPMVIVATVSVVEHRKVPEIEQVLSSGASVQNLIMAAHFLQIGAMWRTGDICFNPYLKELLGLQLNQSIVGFIYLGQEEGAKRAIPEIEQTGFVEWM